MTSSDNQSKRMQHRDKSMIERYFLKYRFQEELHMVLNAFIWADVRVVEKVTEKITDHWEHL